MNRNTLRKLEAILGKVSISLFSISVVAVTININSPIIQFNPDIDKTSEIDVEPESVKRKEYKDSIIRLDIKSDSDNLRRESEEIAEYIDKNNSRKKEEDILSNNVAEESEKTDEKDNIPVVENKTTHRDWSIEKNTSPKTEEVENNIHVSNRSLESHLENFESWEIADVELILNSFFKSEDVKVRIYQDGNLLRKDQWGIKEYLTSVLSRSNISEIRVRNRELDNYGKIKAISFNEYRNRPNFNSN